MSQLIPLTVTRWAFKESSTNMGFYGLVLMSDDRMKRLQTLQRSYSWIMAQNRKMRDIFTGFKPTRSTIRACRSWRFPRDVNSAWTTAIKRLHGEADGLIGQPQITSVYLCDGTVLLSHTFTWAVDRAGRPTGDQTAAQTWNQLNVNRSSPLRHRHSAAVNAHLSLTHTRATSNKF